MQSASGAKIISQAPTAKQVAHKMVEEPFYGIQKNNYSCHKK
jgi:hypothetical protein